MESSLNRKILAWARTQPDVWLAKYHGSVYGLRGHPDLYGHVAGLAVYLETKRPGKGLRKLQAKIGRDLARTGARFARIESFRDFTHIVEELRKNALYTTSALG